MGAVGRVSLPAGERGEWNPQLFERFRRAKGERRRFLLGEIIKQNEPLIKKLTAQLRGVAGEDGKAFAVRFRGGNFGRVLESERLEWDDALNCGRIAMAKALERFDPSKGSLPNYLKKKIFYELQAGIAKRGVVTVERGESTAPMLFAKDEPHMDRLLSYAAEMGGEEGYTSPEQAIDEPEFERPHFDSPPPEPPPPPPDPRRALAYFLEERCQFGRYARCVETALRGAFFSVALERGEYVTHDALSRALREREIRRVTMRVPWSERPVQGLGGVALTIDARAPLLQKARCEARAEGAAISRHS